jgi:hypothetical protein
MIANIRNAYLRRAALVAAVAIGTPVIVALVFVAGGAEHIRRVFRDHTADVRVAWRGR